jgi:hypothetical protein
MARRLAIAGLAGLVLLGISVVVLVTAGRSLYSRAAFGTWDPQALPTRISYCDRDYLPGSHVARIEIDEEVNSFGTFPLRQVGSTADGKPIFARPLPDSVRHKYPNAAPLPCSMTVYLQVGADDYVAYGLNGGP